MLAVGKKIYLSAGESLTKISQYFIQEIWI